MSLEALNQEGKYELRITRITVSLPGEAIFSDSATSVEIDDEAGGEFIRVIQPSGGKEASIAINLSEWPAIRRAVETLIGWSRKDG